MKGEKMDVLSFMYGLMAGLAIASATGFITYGILCLRDKKKEE